MKIKFYIILLVLAFDSLGLAYRTDTCGIFALSINGRSIDHFIVYDNTKLVEEPSGAITIPILATSTITQDKNKSLSAKTSDTFFKQFFYKIDNAASSKTPASRSVAYSFINFEGRTSVVNASITDGVWKNLGEGVSSITVKNPANSKLEIDGKIIDSSNLKMIVNLCITPEIYLLSSDWLK